MIDEVERIADRILSRESQRREEALRLRELNPDFFVPVREAIPGGRFGAVDGGLLAYEYMGFELIAVRAVGVRYTYRNGHLDGVDYYPSPSPPPRFFPYDMPLEEENVGPLRSLTRLLVEIGTAVEFLRNMDLDMLFLDGSILPQLVDKPRGGGSELKRLYRSVIDLYRQLFRISREKGVVLAGVVKDSKGSRLSTYLGAPPYRDASWLHYAMRVGEMTKPVPYADKPEDQATLKDVGTDIAAHVWVFFLKASDLDRPFRVEFYSEDPGLGERIAEVLLPLSRVNRMYTIPPFLLEADIRARLVKQTLSYYKELLDRRLGAMYNFFRMRGANKPF